MVQNSDNSDATESEISSNPEVTVIVPVYKVEHYLRECLDSIEAQTFNDWECILVDDGSPDTCGAICDDYAARDARFKVIHKINGGLSSARNAALDIARGKYITFIDSDDSVLPDFLQHMWTLITTTGADAVQVGYERQFTTYSLPQHAVKERIELDRRQLVRELLLNRKIPSYMWIKMFKREVIDTPFPEGMTFEDIFVLNRWVRNIHKMVLSPEILYRYRQRNGSIINSNYAKNRMEYLKAIPDRLTLLREIEPDAISQQLADKMIWQGLINAAKTIARYTDDKANRDDAIEQISEVAAMFKIPGIGTLGLKRWVRAHLLRNNPHCFIGYIRFFYKLHYRARHAHSHLFD